MILIHGGFLNASFPFSTYEGPNMVTEQVGGLSPFNIRNA